jgi:hypothetical protein
MKIILGAFLLIVASLAPAGATDPLSSLRFLVGSWKCTYQADGKHLYYKAAYSYDLGGDWLRESDSWTGGGSDLGMITYAPKTHGWTSVVLFGRTTTVFHASGDNSSRVAYRSVYPDTTMSDVFERISSTRYTLHFAQSVGGKTMKSTDVCVKT